MCSHAHSFVRKCQSDFFQIMPSNLNLQKQCIYIYYHTHPAAIYSVNPIFLIMLNQRPSLVIRWVWRPLQATPMHAARRCATRGRCIQTPQPETLPVGCFIGARAALFLPFRHSSERDKMGHQQLYWSHPRKFGQGSRSWSVLLLMYQLSTCEQERVNLNEFSVCGSW